MEVIRVSSKQMPSVYVNDVKNKFISKNSIELHALEGGISTAIRAADSLVKYGYAKLVKFDTSLLEDEGRNSNFKGITKVMIRLEKSADFDKSAQEFERNKTTKK
ncbi:hypothetical protein SteCoe_22716 [Stentor coeruleus]|uniref:DNA/RNA-binding protein Alba-like domain-containing protein n=1 Tax=Stentor coeruleus TaxID=5963 RepID=A0A1R2BLH6_9CILI|nr:hypothetical protein SteCoe_22716 [Stentor coeruleus]